jgi:hypothetical protein
MIIMTRASTVKQVRFSFMHPLLDSLECGVKSCMDGVWLTFGDRQQ